MIASKNAYEVATSKNAFSCINDKKNSNWNSFKPNLNQRTRLDMFYAKKMLSNEVDDLNLPDNNYIVYYHDRSISKEEENNILNNKWTNRFWKPDVDNVIVTPHFKFYGVLKNT